MPTKQIIQTPELLKILQNEGIDLTPANLSRFLRTYNLKKAPFLMKQDYDVKTTESGKTYRYARPLRKVTSGIYYKPTESELKEIKKQYDANILKKTDSGPGKIAFDKRKKKAIQLLKTKKYTINEVNELLKKQFPEIEKSGMKSTLTKLAKNIKGIPSGTTGETATLVKNITNDLKKLNKSEVKKLLKEGDTNLEKLIKKTEKILNVDNSLAARRIGQLIEAVSGVDDSYLKVKKDDLFTRRVGPLLKGLGEIEGTKLFGGIGGGLQRIAAERKVAKDLGKPRAFFSSLRKRIQEIIPGGGYETDEIKNIRSSARFNSSPYSAFIQGIRSDINQDKAKSFDKQTSIYEKRLQEANTFAEKKKIANEYNKKAKTFAAEANKNLKPGQLPVRTLEISFDKPDAVIKNKTALDNYGDLFDDIYKKHGYSFKVPEDVKSVDEIRPFLEGGRGKGQMLKMLAQKAPRIFGIPAAVYLGYQGLTGEAEAAEPDSSLKYNPDIGAFTEIKDVDGIVAPTKVDQMSLLDWMKTNPELTVGGAATASLGSKTVRKGVSTAARGLLRAIGTPLGVGAISLGLAPEEGYDLSDPMTRIGFEAEAAFAKPLVQGSQQIARGIKNPVARRGIQAAFNLGLPAKVALRAARIATPLGLASLAAEGAYYGGKYALNEYNRIKNLSEEEKADIEEQQNIEDMTNEEYFTGA